MGCCVCNSAEIKKLEFVIPVSLSKQKNSEFVDLSLSSGDEIPVKELEEWIVFKSAGSKSLTDSLGIMSTLLQSERKLSCYSKPGSIVDSFAVSYSTILNK